MICYIDLMEKNEMGESIKTAEFKFVVPDMQAGSPGDMDSGTVEVTQGKDNKTIVKHGFSSSETFLVALVDWAKQDDEEWNYNKSENWYREQPEEEPEEDGQELSKFPLEIKDGLVIDEMEDVNSFVFKDGEGVELSFDQVSKIMEEVQEYFKDNKETVDGDS